MPALPIAVFCVLAYAFVSEVFAKKPSKSPEEEFGEAVTKYLSKAFKDKKN